MKKIRSKAVEHENRKEKLIIGGIIVFIMISSVLGYFGSQGGSGQYRYGNFKFKLTEDRMYALKYQGVTFKFNFLPQQMLNISEAAEAAELLNGKASVYTTSDPNSGLATAIAEAEYRMAESLYQVNTMVVPGYITQAGARPVITCLNATEATPVIYFEQRNETAVKLFGNCIKITANTGLNMLALKDQIIYEMLGIL